MCTNNAIIDLYIKKVARDSTVKEANVLSRFKILVVEFFSFDDKSYMDTFEHCGAFP
jgi:hypothetical protein